jgi:hypothetical protein
MSSDLRTMLAQLADKQRPGDIDLDSDLERLIDEGRRRVRRRNFLGGLTGVVSIGLVGGLVAAMALQAGGDSPQPAEQPTPSESSQPPKLSSGKVKNVSTARSQALAAQLAQLAPEVKAVPGAVRNDEEELNADGTTRGHLAATAVWTYPVASGTNSVDLSIEVASGDGRVPQVCDGMDAAAAQRCTEVRTLPDGSTAFIRDSAAAGGHQYLVRLIRPNGIQVFVAAAAQMPPGSTRDSLIDHDGVVTIAQQITVAP